jgi:hypothetical protein
MLIELFKRMRFAPIESYQYVGFGSVAFVDYRMIHRALGIEEMTSIEDVSEDEREIRTRFENNCPYQSIRVVFGHSSAILPTLDFAKPTLLWLDYDNALRRSMCNDVAGVAQTIASGSFIGVTIAGSFPTGKAGETALQHLKDNFPEFVPHDAKVVDYAAKKYPKFARNALHNLLSRAFSDADAGKPVKRRPLQVCNFKYRDGTVDMLTVGWIIVSDAETEIFDSCNFSSLPFFRDGEITYSLKVPLVTPMEIREMERALPNLSTPSLSWIPQAERDAFGNSYRFLPNFAPVEMI